MKKKLFAAAALLLSSSFAYAGNSSGRITHILVHEGDTVIFNVGAHTGKPACSVAGEEWAISLKTETGGAMYSMLLSAAAQKQVVSVVGNDQCDAWGDRENAKFIVVNYN